MAAAGAPNLLPTSVTNLVHFEGDLTGGLGLDGGDPPPPEGSRVLIVLPVGVGLSLIVRLSEVSVGVTAGLGDIVGAGAGDGLK